MNIQSSYLRVALNPNTLPILIENMVKLIKSKNLEFDAVAFRGMSGALVTPMIARMLEKPLIMVRKPHDDSHAGSLWEGFRDLTSYIMIDDCIFTGSTIENMHLIITDKINAHALCKGIFLYNQSHPADFKMLNGERVPVYSMYINSDEKLEWFDGKSIQLDNQPMAA